MGVARVATGVGTSLTKIFLVFCDGSGIALVNKDLRAALLEGLFFTD